MNLRTPLGQVRGLGSARSGTQHWWAQRLTAIALIPLSLWFVVFVIRSIGLGYLELLERFGKPYNVVLLVLMLGSFFYHAALGLQVVIEDYIHGEGAKLLTLLTMKFVMAVFAVSSIYAVLRIALGG